MADIKLSDRVKAVLTASVITANLVVLPPDLERSLYEETNKALKNAGGKWKRGKGHVFDDGTQFLKQAMETGVAKDRVAEYQFFPTPAVLASDLAMYGHIRETHRVLEPSAGDGALVRAILKHQPKEIVAVEIRPEAIAGLDDLLKAYQNPVRQADFLTLTPRDLGGLFDVVIMNPPFTRDADLEHIQHAWKFLKPGGRLVALSSASWMSSLNKKRSAFGTFVQENDGEFQRLQEYEFGRTTQAPCLIQMNRPGGTAAEIRLAQLLAV